MIGNDNQLRSDTNANNEVNQVDDEDEYNPNINDSKSDEHYPFLDAKYDDLDDKETQASRTSVSNHVEVSLTADDKYAYTCSPRSKSLSLNIE